MPSFPYWVVLTSSNVSKKYVFFCMNNYQFETQKSHYIKRRMIFYFLQVTKDSPCIKKLISIDRGQKHICSHLDTTKISIFQA